MLSSVSVFLAVIALARASGPAVSTQFHAQDELGQYTYGYSGGPSSKTETKTADGVVTGGYSYVDGHGLVQSASYVADPHNGFRVAATNLPVGPAAPVAPVIAAAPVIKALPAPAPIAPIVKAVPAAIPAPVIAAAPAYAPAYAAPAYAAPAYAAHAYAAPVVYAAGYIPGVETPEVSIAKAAHIQAVHETKALLHSWRRKRSIPYSYAAYPYSYAVPKGFSYSSVTHHYPTYQYPAYPAAAYAAYPAAYPAYPAAHAAAPLPVGDTPAVAAAKAAHFAAVHEAKARVGAAYAPVYPAYAAPHASYAPVPVTDTPAVAHAKAAHFAAVHEAKAKAYAHHY